jgi:hypothetical protein
LTGRKNIHRGQVLAAAILASKYKMKDAARRAGYSRSALYKQIEKPDLAFHVLMKYGVAIGYDFSDEIPRMPIYSLEDPDALYREPDTLEEALRLLSDWRHRYLELLEKYNAVLEKQR